MAGCDCWVLDSTHGCQVQRLSVAMQAGMCGGRLGTERQARAVRYVQVPVLRLPTSGSAQREVVES